MTGSQVSPNDLRVQVQAIPSPVPGALGAVQFMFGTPQTQTKVLLDPDTADRVADALREAAAAVRGQSSGSGLIVPTVDAEQIRRRLNGGG